MKLSRNQKGFTLVELLVVIAVLGILAAVILVAINPIEQLARGRDAARKTAVGQVANALQAYYTTHASVAAQGYPPIAGVVGHATANWLAEVVWSREIKQLPVIVNYTAAGSAACTTNVQVNYCYNTDVTGNAVIYARMESQAENSKCTVANQVAYFVWASAAGRAGVVCSTVAAEPSALAAPVFIE